MSTTSKAAFNAGVQAFRDHKYNEAVEKFSDAISLGTQSHAALDSRAAAYEKLGRYKEALRDSRKVIDQYPDLPQGYSRASKLLTAVGNHDKAIALAHKAVARVKPGDPKLGAMQLVLENALLAQHDHELELKSKECHITKLPVELLALIFEDLVQRHRTSPGLLAHVCAQWRELTFSMPSLWCRLVLDRRGNKQEARTAFWLRQSRGRIRQLRVTTTEKYFTECMGKLAASAAANLEEIEFDLQLGDSLPPFFRFKADPISFSWNVSGGVNLEMRRLPFEPKMGPFRIRELKIRGVSMYWTIEAQQLENLTTLVVEHGNLMILELLVILERSPGIQTLTIQTSYENPLPERKERLVLANLTTLKLLFNCLLLRYIEVPTLHTLEFEATSVGDMLHDLSPITPPLISLSLRQCIISKAAVLPLPDTLQRLKLTSLAYNVDSVVEKFAEGQCPNITELDLSNTTIGAGPIQRLIRARNPPISDEDEEKPRSTKLELLIMDGCEGIPTDSLQWIRSKVPRVSCVYERRPTKRQRIK